MLRTAREYTKFYLQTAARFLAAFTLVFLPLSVSVNSLAVADGCTPPSYNTPGVHVPTGSDAVAFTYNCASGMWVSAHFIYNPITDTYSATDIPIYTYNPGTGSYDYQEWAYDPATGSYYAATRSIVQPPAGADVVGAPTPPASVPASESSSVPANSGTGSTGGASISNTSSGSSNSIDSSGAEGTRSINGTGPGSSNQINNSGNNLLSSNNKNTIGLTNNLNNQATTGNALVIGNTSAGDAASGNATDAATVVNMLQSAAASLGSGHVVTFVQNINGNINGDLLFDPASLTQIQPATNNPTGNNSITFNNSTNASIDNNINLASKSGNVTVAQNTSAGNATSGAAEAIANVVNLINSAVSAGKSFVGTININGNLNGDILIPPTFIDQLVATNVPTVTISTTGPGSSNNVNGTTSNTVNATNTNNLGITNNIHETAATGNGVVSDNTAGGSGTSGNATNSITAFNLTGSNVIGNNDLLVFVNVLGKWVGMIVNAPQGATAAEFCGGNCSVNNNTSLSGTGPNSTNNTTGSSTNTLNSSNTNNLGIRNNINLASTSGNALINENTHGGNATSGNAKNAANLLNVQNSSFSLANWFGILFINVFGNWFGSFGTNTAAGNPVDTSSNTGTAVNPGAPVPARFFRFVPHSTNGTTQNFALSELPAISGSGGATDIGGSSGTIPNVVRNGTVLAAHNVKGSGTITPAPNLQNGSHNSTRKVALIIAGSCAIYIALDLLYTRRQGHKA